MKFVDDFRVEERSCTICELFYKDQSLGMSLELAVHYNHSTYLFFFTHDCPFEETLTVMLIDIDQKKVIDLFWIGCMYQTDCLRNCRILNDKQISFEFLREKPWVLTINEKMRFNFKGIPLFSSVCHHFWFKTRLKIK